MNNNKTLAELAEEYDAALELLLKLQRRDKRKAKAGDREAVRTVAFREELIIETRTTAERLRHYYD